MFDLFAEAESFAREITSQPGVYGVKIQNLAHRYLNLAKNAAESTITSQDSDHAYDGPCPRGPNCEPHQRCDHPPCPGLGCGKRPSKEVPDKYESEKLKDDDDQTYKVKSLGRVTEIIWDEDSNEERSVVIFNHDVPWLIARLQELVEWDRKRKSAWSRKGGE